MCCSIWPLYRMFIFAIFNIFNFKRINEITAFCEFNSAETEREKKKTLTWLCDEIGFKAATTIFDYFGWIGRSWRVFCHICTVRVIRIRDLQITSFFHKSPFFTFSTAKYLKELLWSVIRMSVIIVCY